MKKSGAVAMVGGLLALVVPVGLDLVASDVQGLALGLWPVTIQALLAMLGATALGLGVQVWRTEQPRWGIALAGVGLAQWLVIALLWAQLRKLTADSAADAALAAPGPAALGVAMAAAGVFGAGLVILASPPRFSADQRFLRVWVQWNGQIVAERLFLRPQTVTVGESADSTFQLAASGVRNHLLLTPLGGHTDRYLLDVPRGVEAHLRLTTGAPDDQAVEIQRGDSGLLQLDNGLLLGFAFAAAETARLIGTSKEQRGLLVSFGAVASVVMLLLFGMAMTKPNELRRPLDKELQDKLQAYIEVQLAEPAPPAPPLQEDTPALEPEGKRAPDPEGKVGDPDKTGETKLMRRTGPPATKPDPREIGIHEVLKQPLTGATAQVLQGDADRIRDHLDVDRLGTASADEEGNGTKGMGYRNTGHGGGGDGDGGQLRGTGDQLGEIGGGEPAGRRSVTLGRRRPKVVGEILVGRSTAGAGCDKGDLIKTVRSATPRIRGCYETQLLSQPSLAGKLTLQWTVGEDGKVRGDKLTGDSLGEPKVSDCVQRAIRSLRFAAPEAGTCVVSWPFVFSPG